jgi:hypothetical protein
MLTEQADFLCGELTLLLRHMGGGHRVSRRRGIATSLGVVLRAKADVGRSPDLRHALDWLLSRLDQCWIARRRASCASSSPSSPV